tara:strand:- start:1151 stop:1474 length:324 start_codon:yes stop_codon:yes gene_type:complete
MKEGTLYFKTAGTGTNAALIMPASNLIGVRLSAANRAQFEFRALTGAAKRTNAQVNFTGSFEELCKAVAGSLNSNTMTVVADEVNSVFLAFNGGVCTSIQGVDDVTA